MVKKADFLITMVMCAAAAALIVAQYAPALAAEAHRGTSRAVKTNMATPNTKLDEIQSSKFKNIDNATPKIYKHYTSSSGDTTAGTQGKGVKRPKFDVNAVISGNKGSSASPQSATTGQSTTIRDISATKLNPTNAIFGNQPFTHPKGTPGTGAGPDTGTGTGLGSMSGTGSPGVRAANSEKSATQSTVVDPPRELPVLENRQPSDLLKTYLLEAPDHTTITSSPDPRNAIPTPSSDSNQWLVTKCKELRDGEPTGTNANWIVVDTLGFPAAGVSGGLACVNLSDESTFPNGMFFEPPKGPTWTGTGWIMPDGSWLPGK